MPPPLRYQLARLFRSEPAAFSEFAYFGDHFTDVPPVTRIDRNERRNGNPVTGDRDSFAPGHPVEKLREVRLGFVRSDLLHPRPP